MTLEKIFYAINTDLESPIYRYQHTTEPEFVIADELLADLPQVIDALFEKYYTKLDGGELFDYYDVLVNEEWNLSEKELEYLNLVPNLENSIMIGR